MPMTQEVAFEKAQQLWGTDAVVGINFNCNKLVHVGVKGTYDIWLKRGHGKTFEEAFEKVKDKPDGYSPYMDM